MKLLDQRAVSELTGIACKTLENWRSLGQGPAFHKLGARVLYAEADLESWLASRRRPVTRRHRR